MKKEIALLIFLSIIYIQGKAQLSWQWARGGGSNHAYAQGDLPDDIEDLTTDKWGNIYVVSDQYGIDPYIEYQNFTALVNPFGQQICVACFKCDGSLKWYKMIVGNANNEGISIKTDTFGGVYIAGRLEVFNASVLGGIDSGFIMNQKTIDTIFAPPLFPYMRTIFLLKLDTLGNYKWFRQPEPDSTTTYAAISSFPIDMDVDNLGNSYLLAELKPGVYGCDTCLEVAESPTMLQKYILKYDSAGNFINGYKLPFMEKTNKRAQFHLVRDAIHNRFYMNGYAGDSTKDTLFINNQKITGTFLACLSDTGTLIWLAHEDNNTSTGRVQNRIAIDTTGNLYLFGTCTDNYSFNGTAFSGGSVFVVKIDTNGHNVWIAHSTDTGNVASYGIAIAKDTIAVVGTFAHTKINWGNESIDNPSLNQQTWVARLNGTNGNAIAMNHIKTNNKSYPADGAGFAFGSNGSITTDLFGNFYMGGYYTNQFYLAGDTLNSLGINGNWWLAKLGTPNCGSYFAQPVKKNYNDLWHELKLYTTPATNQLTIENAPPKSELKIFNINGKLIYTSYITSAKQDFDLEKYEKGIYSIQLTEPKGSKVNRTIMKE